MKIAKHEDRTLFRITLDVLYERDMEPCCVKEFPCRINMQGLHFVNIVDVVLLEKFKSTVSVPKSE